MRTLLALLALSGLTACGLAWATPAKAAELPAAQTGRLMDDLVAGPTAAQEALRTVLAARDRRFVAVLVELLWANEVGVAHGAGLPANLRALERLSGRRLGTDWAAWIEWYGATSLRPPPGFTPWKGRLLARIDPGFGAFLRAGARSRLRVEEVVWGGVLIDGIPALDNPRMIPAAKATYLEPGEPVFGLSLNGDSRAYPLRILDWHELANDVVGRVPVSLAYCTLCGSGIVFAGRASDRRTYTFGSSGLLFRSNKLMYDRQTRTLWNQLTGRPVLGRLAATGVRLRVLPDVVTSWASWREEHPDTLVLDVETGFDRLYEPGAAYGEYFSSARRMFPVWQRRDDLPEKARVFGLRLGGVPKAYPLDLLTARRVVNDAVAGVPVVLVATRGTVTVEVRLAAGPVRYVAGGEVRAFRRGKERFEPGPDAGALVDSAGRPWRVTEDALIGPGGRRAARLPGHLAYWFGWYAFFPRTLLYGKP